MSATLRVILGGSVDPIIGGVPGKALTNNCKAGVTAANEMSIFSSSLTIVAHASGENVWR